MNKNWPTKDKDIFTAQKIMEEYAKEQKSELLSLLELVVNPLEKQMGFKLANWVLALANYFSTTYGAEQGDYVTRQVITRCLRQGQTLH